jgi:hypothetical protein
MNLPPSSQGAQMNENSALVAEILKGLQMERSSLGLRLTYHWRNGRGGTSQILGEVIFFLIGLAFFIFPLLGLLTSLAQGMSMTLLQWATTLPFLLAGFFVLYRGLGNFINTSVFEVTATEFKTWNGPLPFLGDQKLTLPCGEFSKIEWKQVGHSSRGDTSHPRSGYSATYDVVVHTTQGQEVKLLSGLPDRDYAFAIQGELSRFIQPAGQ